MLHQNQLRHALQIINSYGPVLPLHIFLRNYFRLNKGFGSKDRRLYRHLAYSYFRTGHNFEDWGQQVKLVLSSFIVAGSADSFLDFWLQEITPFSPADTALPLQKKFTKLKEAGYEFSEEKLFPWKHLLGNISNHEDFIYSHLRQPYTWIKVHKNTHAVLAEAEKIGIKPLVQKDGAIGFAPADDVMRLKLFEKGYFEVQDISSQRTAELMQPKPGEKWWDCCAGAGGKTLLLKNISDVDVLATDKRGSILQNLKERTQRHGYNVRLRQMDILKDELPVSEEFDGIIVDAPCSGSGTWGRNPEHVNFFKESELEKYSFMQKEIANSVAIKLKPGGKLIYITCSVFKEENEMVIEWLQDNTRLSILEWKYFEGFNEHADTLFGAVLKLPNA